jgi:aspartyl-tRNA(Asn)/glutamyl-tRNA(Gln) amidotransferase subunit A
MNNLTAWEKAVEVLSKKGNVKFLEISLPHVQYSMSCYSVLTSCEVASNFARYDGVKFGHREVNNKEQGPQSLDNMLKNTRNSGFGEVVKGRIVSGNFFLLKEYVLKIF